MDIEKILEKFKDTLTEGDLILFRDQIKEMIAEEAQKRADLIIEEKTKVIQEASEKFIADSKEEIKKELEVEYDAKMEQLEEQLCTEHDKVLDTLIAEKISDDLIKKQAILETYKPIVDDIMKVFSEHSIEVDTEGSSMVSKLKTENESITKQLSEALVDKVDLTEKLEKISTKYLISEKIVGLNDEQKARVISMFESKKYEEVEKGIDSMIDLVISEETKKDKPVEDKTIVEGDGISKEGKKPITESSSIADLAKTYFK